MKEEFEKLYKFKISDTQEETLSLAIEGIASVYDVIDKDGELIKTGAFDSQIGKIIPIYVMHNGVGSTVGTVEISQRGSQILVKGELFDNELGKTIALAKSKGVQYNLSIGGKRTEYGWEKLGDKDVLVTTKGTIREVSIIDEDRQAHQDAIVTKQKKEEIEEEQMELDYIKLAKELAKEMEKSEQGTKTNEEMLKLQSEVKTLKEEIEKSKGTDEKLAQLSTVLEKMDKTINELTAPGNFEKGANASLEKEMAEYEKALKSRLDGADFEKAITTTQGANLIPQLLSNEIIKTLRLTNPFYAESKVYRGIGTSMEIPVRSSWTNTVEGVAEGNGVVTNGVLTWTKITIEAGVIQSEISLTDEMRQDTYFNIQAEITGAVTEDFGAYLADKIVNGTVAATQKFEGFTKNATLAGAARVTETTLKISADDLMDLELDLEPSFRVGAKYYASKDVIRDMKTMKDTQGQYLWSNSTQAGTPSTFNGYPVIETPYMQGKTAGAWVTGNIPVLFANFGRLYGIYEKVGFETEMERKATNRLWNNITRMRVGGKVVNPQAGVLLKIK